MQVGAPATLAERPTPAFVAFRGNDPVAVTLARNKPVEILATYVERSAELFRASRDNDLASVTALLACNELDVNMAVFEQTSLSIACFNGHNDVARLLLADPRVDVNAVACACDGISRPSPLVLAIYFDNWQLFEMLMKHEKIDVNWSPRDNEDNVKAKWNTPLFTACRRNRPEYVKRLLEAPGIDINIESTDGPALNAAICHSPRSLALLLADPRIRLFWSMNHDPPIIRACRWGVEPSVLMMLLDHPDSYPKQGSADGRTAIEICFNTGHHELLKVLLTHKSYSEGVPEKSKCADIIHEFNKDPSRAALKWRLESLII